MNSICIAGEASAPMDPIRFAVLRHHFQGICEEMGAALEHSAFSPNIKERRDFSCALFDARGEMVAQAEHIPVHLGSMPYAVRAILARAESIRPGELWIMNDPYEGGTHLPDITLVGGFFRGARLRFFVATRAHHADIGGAVPGSMALTEELYQEGIRIPPVRLVRNGEWQEELLSFLLANVRTPRERRGDLRAQAAAIHTGVRRLQDTFERFGSRDVHLFAGETRRQARRAVQAVVRAVPDGTYRFEDYLEGGESESDSIRLRVAIRVRGARARIDFSGTSEEVRGCLNAPRSVTMSAIFYVLRCLSEVDFVVNSGALEPLTIRIPKGCLLEAAFPAAVCGGNVETSQRVVDLLLGALARGLPDLIPAASAGTMTNLSIGGIDPRNGVPYAYYETVAGGHGAGAWGPGADGVHCHMTNTQNTPIEALERSYPLRVVRYALRQGSGGRGRHRGGHGLVRELEMRARAQLSLLADRRRIGPYGLRGGEAGKPGRDMLQKGSGWRRCSSKVSVVCSRGDRIRVATPGGGGWGSSKSSL